jgi:hypothetical protein
MQDRINQIEETSCAVQQNGPLLDHFVDKREQSRRDSDAEYSGRLQIDDKFTLWSTASPACPPGFSPLRMTGVLDALHRPQLYKFNGHARHRNLSQLPKAHRRNSSTGPIERLLEPGARCCYRGSCTDFRHARPSHRVAASPPWLHRDSAEAAGARFPRRSHNTPKIFPQCTGAPAGLGAFRSGCEGATGIA